MIPCARFHFALLLIAGISAVAVLGCNKQRNGLPFQSATTAAGITSLQAPVGPFPRGVVDPRHLADPATVGPVISVTSPGRGSVTTQPQVSLTLQVEDPDGVVAVEIAGAATQDLGGGSYRATVTLAPGANLIDYRAEDARGNVTTGYTSILRAAQVVPAGSFVPRSVAVELSDPGLDRVARIAEDLTQGVDLFPLISGSNPLVSVAGLQVTAVSLTHQPPRFALAGAPDGIRAELHLDDVAFAVQVDMLGFGLMQASILANRASGFVQARIHQGSFSGNYPGKRTLGLEVTQVRLDLDRFRVVSNSGLVTGLLNPFNSLIESAVRKELESVLLTLLDDTLKDPLGGIDRPLSLPINLPNQAPTSLEARFELHQAYGPPAGGLVLVAGVEAAASTPLYRRDLVLQGVSFTPQPFGGQRAFNVKVGSDALNAFLGALQETGRLGVVIDGTAVPKPGATMIPSAKLLYPFFPLVKDLCPDPDTPIVIEVDLQAPPIARFGVGVADYSATLPEAEVRLWIDYLDGGPRLLLFALRIGVEVGVDLSVTATSLLVDSLVLGSLKVEVVAEPAGDMDDQGLEAFIQAAAPTLLGDFATSVGAVPIPALPFGLKLDNPQLSASRDVLLVQGDLIR